MVMDDRGISDRYCPSADHLGEPIGYIRHFPVWEDECGPFAIAYQYKTDALVCDACGEWEFAGDHLSVYSLNLCGPCADRVMNLKHHQHTGQYLTWPNPQPEKPKKKVISPGLRREVYERDTYACRYCGARKDLTLDHVVPESKGGEATAGNLVTCCKFCNSKKGTRTLDEAGMTLHPVEAFA
jgi:5-methylcytosine-specific restriction endonuclease McrA